MPGPYAQLPLAGGTTQAQGRACRSPRRCPFGARQFLACMGPGIRHSMTKPF